jgi:hypothetical protein
MTGSGNRLPGAQAIRQGTRPVRSGLVNVALFAICCAGGIALMILLP